MEDYDDQMDDDDMSDDDVKGGFGGADMLSDEGFTEVPVEEDNSK